MAWQKRRQLVLTYLLIKRRRHIRKSVGVCQIFKLRKTQGAYNNLVAEMRLHDHKKFRNYHRMSVEDFDKLVGKVSPFILKKFHSTEPIFPGEMLSATLRYLAAGVSMKTISYEYRLGVSTVSNIVKETCEAIWLALNDEFLPTPNEDMWKKIATDFEEKWQFPNCIGAIDGRHIRIQAPPNTGSDFFNYKEYFSMVLMAICDANYCFTVVDIGARGRQSDGGIFRNSTFGKMFFSNSIDLPQPREISKTSGLIPFLLVGDNAFPFGVNLMRPYPGNYLAQEQRIFNYRLSRARRIIENSFGILVTRWTIFNRPIIAKLSTIEKIIKATVCLHNFLRMSDLRRPDAAKYCPSTFVDREDAHGKVIDGEWRSNAHNNLPNVLRMGGNAYTKTASAIRSALTNYFLNDLPIDPQWSK